MIVIEDSPADRYRRKLAHRRSPEENLARFERLQREAFELLRSNPKALAAFHRRNRRKRRTSEAAKLLAKLKAQTSNDQ